MNNQNTITWEFLKIVKDTLDSYRIRALIDAKDDIISREIYSEEEYYDLLFSMFDLEKIKHEIYDKIKEKPIKDFEYLRNFAQEKSIKIHLVLYLLELLRHENLITINYFDNKSDSKFKHFKIESLKSDLDKIKNVYEPVRVIFDAKICSGCGMCVAYCPMKCIAMINGFGAINDDLCIKCGLCYLMCPRTVLPTDVLYMMYNWDDKNYQTNMLGSFLEAYSARTTVSKIQDICQDGGITTTCLHYLFSNNKIDVALGARTGEVLWKPEPFKMESSDEALSCAGTKYVNNPNLSLLNDKTLNDKDIAVVGVPCQMQAALKSKIYDLQHPRIKKVKYLIGIFCMESFPFKEGFLKICELLDIQKEDIKKTDINKGKFLIYTHSGNEISVPIKEITHLARPDCETCYDLTSECADVSIGSIGSPSGWNTVLIRTPIGKKLFEELKREGLIEIKKFRDVKPGLDLLIKIAKSKRNKCTKHIDSKLAENQRIPYY